MKETKVKSNNGITLISLIVTIIVLIILAGISISILSEDSSVVKKATDAQILTELSNVREAVELYKIQKHRDGDMSDEELVEDGVLKEILIKDTYRTLGIIVNLEEIDIKSKLGKAGEKQEETEVETIQNLYDVYGIDMSDGTLYYIRDGIWSIEGTKVTYISDAGEEKEGYLVETLDKEFIEKRKFITEWQVSEGTTITLPIAKVPDITIEWGDGDTEKCVVSKPTHTYEKAGTYEIKISGNMEKWDFNNVNISRDYITKLKQWGNTNITTINFSNCINLSGNIPNDDQKGLKNVTSVVYLFYNCSKLTGSIPSNLFENCSQAGNFGSAFRGCTSLTGEIPKELFKNCSQATSFGYLFFGCAGLTGEIPEELFSNCTNVTLFGHAFNGCENLEGNIPEKLFENCSKVTSVRQAFSGCTGLTGTIPENLFNNSTIINDFYGTFQRCTGLTGSIPQKLFKSCAAEITNLENVFSNCTGLTGTIPEGLFANCIKASNLKNIF